MLDGSNWEVNQTERRTRDARDDDDEAEKSTFVQSGSRNAQASFKKGGGKKRDKKAERGQNKNRQFGRWGDTIQLCNSRALRPEFSPDDCRFGDKCRLEHDLRKYLADGKSADLTTFEGKCPNFELRGTCHSGWKCRFVGSHSNERDTEDGRKELVLLGGEINGTDGEQGGRIHADEDVLNVISQDAKFNLSRRKTKTPKTDIYITWLSEDWNRSRTGAHQASAPAANAPQTAVEVTKDTNPAVADDPKSLENDEEDLDGEDGGVPLNGNGVEPDVTLPLKNENSIKLEGEVAETKLADVKMNDHDISTSKEEKADRRAAYTEPPFLPSEKRRIYYGPETPILAPLTTQGNLPFRRLCVELGAQVTWSEMAMSMPLIQGDKGEWALTKCHTSEITPPRVNNAAGVAGYDNAKDLKFGIQVSANKPWLALKTAEILSTHVPHVRAIDLNCGCPIDLVYQSGAGSALLENGPKLEKMLRGMNALSGEIPITAKIRMGTKDKEPIADKIVTRLVLGGHDARTAGFGPPGVAAIALHGRSRQQRYSRAADWEYIADIAALINRIQKQGDALSDTAAEADARDKPNGEKTYFIGNGDCYSHVDYYNHIRDGNVDSVMVARGALIKPWIFEEIESGQHLDKSATERLGYIEKFARYGLECWGSDETGVGTTRRFLLEWLGFNHRYVPIGLLETLPPKLNERPPRYRGRNELETLLASKVRYKYPGLNVSTSSADSRFRFLGLPRLGQDHGDVSRPNAQGLPVRAQAQEQQLRRRGPQCGGVEAGM